MFSSRVLSTLLICSAVAAGIVGSILAFPAVWLGWLLHQYCASSWNQRDRWAGVWVCGCVSLLIYGLLAWRLHLLSVLLMSAWQGAVTYHFPQVGRSILLLWLYNGSLLVCPAALIYEVLAPHTPRFTMLPRRRTRFTRGYGEPGNV